MELDEDIKREIDEMSYSYMAERWRFSPCGDLIFLGESGDYFAKVMAENAKSVNTAKVSKEIGWGGVR